MRKTRFTPLGANTFAIRVDSYEDGVMKGMVAGPMLAAPVPFNTLVGLIIMIDEMLDANEDDEELLPPKTSTQPFTPTLELEVMFRQHHSWQGRVRWLEGEREATFRSVLELLIVVETIFAP